MTQIHFIDIAIAVLGMYGLLKAEHAYKMRKWRAARKPLEAADIDPLHVGHVANAAEAVPCGKCEVMTKYYHLYADGDKWCDSCHHFE